MPPRSTDDGASEDAVDRLGTIEFLLFDSLVHHLIEKGVLTKNDALSVVQTAAAVVRGRVASDVAKDKEIAVLERIYVSFEAMADRNGRLVLDGHNVHPLRTPLHGDRPSFPPEDD